MTSVLLSSSTRGSSSWIFLRKNKGIKVQGMREGDRLDVAFFPPRDELSIEADGIFPLPEADRLQVIHVDAADRESASGVNVDLVRSLNGNSDS